MSVIVLFHSALGLRPALLRLADRLRTDGHTVYTPDLFEGRVFERLEDGVAHRDALGIPAMMQRASSALAGLPEEVFLLGYSMGAAAAQWLAATRPKIRGVVLVHGALPPAAFGITQWPDVPLQIHVGSEDPWVDASAVDSLPAEVHRYDAPGHLFTDEDSPDYHPDAAARVEAAIRSFVR